MHTSPERELRPLAQVEVDLLAAEKAFHDAAARLNEANRDLDAALRLIDQHQSELDLAIAALRERSPAGSRWSSGRSSANELLLSSEYVSDSPVAAEVSDAPSANVQDLAMHFDRLREVVRGSTPCGDT